MQRCLSGSWLGVALRPTPEIKLNGGRGGRVRGSWKSRLNPAVFIEIMSEVYARRRVVPKACPRGRAWPGQAGLSTLCKQIAGPRATPLGLGITPTSSRPCTCRTRSEIRPLRRAYRAPPRGYHTSDLLSALKRASHPRNWELNNILLLSCIPRLEAPLYAGTTAAGPRCACGCLWPKTTI